MSILYVTRDKPLCDYDKLEFRIYSINNEGALKSTAGSLHTYT